MEKFEDKLIEVCGKCKRACCWYGELMCEIYGIADPKLMTVSELRWLDLENEEYWSDEMMERIYGEAAPFGYL